MTLLHTTATRWAALPWSNAMIYVLLLVLFVCLVIIVRDRESRPFVSNRELDKNSQEWSVPVVRAIFKALWGAK